MIYHGGIKDDTGPMSSTTLGEHATNDSEMPVETRVWTEVPFFYFDRVTEKKREKTAAVFYYPFQKLHVIY